MCSGLQITLKDTEKMFGDFGGGPTNQKPGKLCEAQPIRRQESFERRVIGCPPDQKIMNECCSCILCYSPIGQTYTLSSLLIGWAPPSLAPLLPPASCPAQLSAPDSHTVVELNSWEKTSDQRLLVYQIYVHKMSRCQFQHKSRRQTERERAKASHVEMASCFFS